MSNPTNQSQDNELDKAIETIMDYWDFEPFQDEDRRRARVKKEIKTLCTQSRSTLLDEIERELPENYKPSWGNGTSNETLVLTHSEAMVNEVLENVRNIIASKRGERQ